IGTGTTLKCGPGPGSGGPEGGGSSSCCSSGPAESPPHASSARARSGGEAEGCSECDHGGCWESGGTAPMVPCVRSLREETTRGSPAGKGPGEVARDTAPASRALTLDINNAWRYHTA